MEGVFAVAVVVDCFDGVAVAVVAVVDLDGVLDDDGVVVALVGVLVVVFDGVLALEGVDCFFAIAG